MKKEEAVYGSAGHRDFAARGAGWADQRQDLPGAWSIGAVHLQLALELWRAKDGAGEA